MTETMTATSVKVIVPCPSCARPMSPVGDGWQCLACRPTPMNIPTCKTQICKRPLTKLGEPWNCWICLKCNKHPEVVNKMKKEDDQRKRTYIDKKLTTDDVSEMIKKEMAGVKDMIREALVGQKPDYPPTQAEIQAMTAPETLNAKPETIMQKAKRLGVRTHNEGTGGRRTTADIMVDISAVEKAEARADAAIEKVLSNEKSEETIDEANAFRETAQSPPGEDDEYARGLKASDMMNVKEQ